MIIAIIQARVSSTRLPGKVLKSVLGKALLAWQIERVSRCSQIDRLIVATSDELSDEPIAKLCSQQGVEVFRGKLNNVLDRMYQAAKPYHPKHVVRLTGDCPLSDPDIIDAVISQHLKEANDYTSNALKPTFPDGLDVEVMTFAALEAAWKNAKLPSEHEHVTPYICKHPEQFKLGNYQGKQDYSHYRWTVDEPEDFEFVRQVFESLYPVKPNFGWQDVLRLLQENPDLLKINQKFERNEGMKKSLLADKKIQEKKYNV